MSRENFGSTVSLHGLQAGGEPIPREYHRRVLKKIAQLTKVIYALNTKNDEHEHFVARLKATHEEDIDRILCDCSKKLQECKESVLSERETMEASLKESLLAVENERDQLYREQVSYRTTVEDRLMSIRAQHTDKVLSLTTQLEKLKNSQAKQIQDVKIIQAEVEKKVSKEMEEIRKKHQLQMKALAEKMEGDFSRERTSLEAIHATEISRLKKTLEDEIKQYRQALMEYQGEIVAIEKKLAQEREKALKNDFSQKEEELNQQISTLSGDLRMARDKLALSEKKVADLLSQFEEGQASSADRQAQLEESEAEVGRLKAALRESTVELEISREHYKQQSEELKGMAGKIGHLEALRVSHEGSIEDLKAQLNSMEEKARLLEEEKAALEDSNCSTSESHLAQIKALEQELGRLHREKQELRLQYAREIEAAHAQLGQRESQMGTEHLRALQNLKEENKQAALQAKLDQEAALEALRQQLEHEKEEALFHLQEQSDSRITLLEKALSERNSELELARLELKRLESELARREQGLGSATSTLDRLREELSSVREELVTAVREKEGSNKERDLLLSNVEGLKEQAREMVRSHKEKVAKLRKDLVEQLEEKWKEKLKEECASLRKELSSRHLEDSRTALAELANIKDRAFDSANKKWEEQKEKLTKKISELEMRLKKLKESNHAELDEARSTADSRVSILTHKLEELERCHGREMAAQKQMYDNDLHTLELQFTTDKEQLTKSLKNQHSRQCQEIQHAHQLAVQALKEILQHESLEQLEEAEARHREKLAGVQAELSEEYEREKSTLLEVHRQDTQRQQERINQLMEEKNHVISDYEKTVSGLNSEMRRRDAELAKLRDKVNTLMVTSENMKKDLEVKGQEVLTIRREASSLLQQRTSELVAAHEAELDSQATQYKHQAQILISEFNNAKVLFAHRVSVLENEVADWEQKHKRRESKPEDLNLIKELQALTQQQKLKIKDLIAEKRVYQLELMNREKNYNQVFNANPLVGVLNPLMPKQKRENYDFGNRYPSAPSLMSSPEPHPQPPNHPPPPMLSSLSNSLLPSSSTSSSQNPGIGGSLITSFAHAGLTGPIYAGLTSSTNSGLTSSTHSTSPHLLARREQQKPKKLMLLKDSPQVPKPKGTNRRGSVTTSSHSGGGGAGGGGNSMRKESLGAPMKPLDPIPTTALTTI